jgi:hypothetical protein
MGSLSSVSAELVPCARESVSAIASQGHVIIAVYLAALPQIDCGAGCSVNIHGLSEKVPTGFRHY